ncbi:hypothetical protein PIB30_031151 [Stylosanthes scabra]|uniref:Uncharacterized protein n=1 Tax=Stylosanthes scabra TaxID=79078 RepID=A0ABU6YAS9_9FABA|nr:hypothetical protein [Stylosanthes scabra]
MANDSGQRQIKKYKPKPAYYVEIPDDSDEDGDEAYKVKQEEATEQQGLELALILENTLVLKRKWKEDDQPMYNMHIMLNNADNDEQENNKSKKGAAKSNMAEEAGLMKPHHKP